MHTTFETSIYHKSCPEAFGYMLSSVNSKKEKSIMIVDYLEIDIVGEKNWDKSDIL